MANTKEIQKSRYDKRIKAAKELLRNKCRTCGSLEDLEFDHIDPSTKSFVISTWIARKKWAVILEELKKCQLLCTVCHTVKTISDKGQLPAVHGRDRMYRNGCRCNECKQAHSLIGKAYQLYRKSRAGVQ